MNSQKTTMKKLLLSPLGIGVEVILIARVLFYFLKFFGFSIQATIMKSMSIQENVKLYTNLLLLLALFLLGSFVIIVLLFKRPKENHREAKTVRNLSENASNILTFLGKQGKIEYSTEYFAKKFNLSFNQAQAAIDELYDLDFLGGSYHVPGEDRKYHLSTKGRSFLARNYLL